MICRKILIIERDKTIVKNIKKHFKQNGYSVFVEGDVSQALLILEKSKFDFVLLDEDLCDTNRFNTIKKFKSGISDFLILIGTNRDVKEVLYMIQDKEVFAYLPKPIDLQYMESILKKGLKKKKLEKERIYLKEKSKELNFLSELNALIGATLDPKKIVDTVVTRTSDIVPVNTTTLLFSSKGKIYITMNSNICLNDSIMNDTKEEIIKNYTKIIGAKISSEEIIFKLKNNDELVKNNKVVLIPTSKKTRLNLPLIVENQKIGIISFARFSDKGFKKNQIRLLSTLANQTATALKNASEHCEINELASIDSLTKTFNHRVFHDILEREFNRYKRYKSSLSLIMLDIDYFKNVNDSFGHQIGDQILKELASLLTLCIRQTDIIARYGGEEFAIVLPETSIEHAYILAERMRKKIASHRFDYFKKSLHITISLGVSNSSSLRTKDKDELIYLADEALYLAKRKGRNQTCVSKGKSDQLKISS